MARSSSSSPQSPTVDTAPENGRPGPAATSAPVVLSAALPPSKIIRTYKVWSKLLHAAVLPLLVGVAIFWLQGQFSMGLFQQAWPIMAALAAAYVGAWRLSSEFERYPFINQFEAALVSVGATLVPVGLVFAGMPRSPTNILALFATVGSIGWFLADKFLHRYRKSRLLVLPGGMTNRLLAVPTISAEDEGGPSGPLDGIVTDLHTSLSDHADVLADCSMKGLPTYHAGYIYELLTARVLLGSSCRTSLDVPTRRYYPYVKRAMDVGLVVLSLPITGPLMALTALAIRLESKGPVLFWQARVGKDGEPFQMAKFRSMYAGNDGEENPQFADETDDRVTRVGRVIRKMRIDELPQFWNVLKGDMSLVGPRPERPFFVEEFRQQIPHYMLRHRVRAGMTGWAQVNGWRGNTSLEKRIEYDLYYIENWSLALDLKILWMTVINGLGHEHAY